MDITVTLSDRTLQVNGTSIDLPDHAIRQLRQLIDSDGFNDTAAEQAIQHLIDQQIRPFLRTADRPITDTTILQELDEALEQHLYSLADQQS